MLARLYWGETPQTPLSVFNVGFAHDGGIPPTPPQIGGDPQTPLSISEYAVINYEPSFITGTNWIAHEIIFTFTILTI